MADVKTEMRCDGCAHWFVDERAGFREWEAEAVGFGECKAIRERWVIADEGSANMDRWSDAPEAEERWTAARNMALKAARAYVQDGSEYRAELYTAPDFFCALFEARS